ncbi:MAG TPA: CBS domain-containing protein, partial [Gaiellaceae bacterium]|nr:CBS domain-containing protein [Gaiellaceae bacterium]
RSCRRDPLWFAAMQVGSVMRTRLVTVRPEDTAAEAIRLMLEAGIGSVVVCEENAPVGIFTERDVLRLAGEAADVERVQLRVAMTRDLVTIGVDDAILDAAQLMGERKLRHLPVVQDGNLVGMVSMRDVLGFLAERLYAERDEAAAATARALLGRSTN